jgi:hypothetical protein
MPWTPNDAERHTHKASTWNLKQLWAKVAFECLEPTTKAARSERDRRPAGGRLLPPDCRSLVCSGWRPRPRGNARSKKFK